MMKQSTKRFISGVAALFMVAGAFIVLFNFIKPAYADVQKLKAEVRAREQFIAGQQQAVKKVRQLISAYRGQEELRDLIGLTLPRVPDIAGGLTQLGGIIQNATLGAQSFSIAVSGANDEKNARAGSEQGKDLSLTRPRGIIDFGVTFTGSYENLKSFLEKLESNVRIFDARSLSIAPSSAAGKQAAQGIYNFDIKVATYYQQ